jgi:hypothetical protein
MIGDEYQACSGKTRECMFSDRGITPGPLRPAGAGGKGDLRCCSFSISAGGSPLPDGF